MQPLQGPQMANLFDAANTTQKLVFLWEQKPNKLLLSINNEHNDWMQ